MPPLAVLPNVLDTASTLDKGVAEGGYRFLFCVVSALAGLLLWWVAGLYRAQARRAERLQEEDRAYARRLREEDRAEARAAEKSQLLVVEAARSLEVLGSRLMEKWDELETEVRERLPRPKGLKLPSGLPPEPPSNPAGKAPP